MVLVDLLFAALLSLVTAPPLLGAVALWSRLAPAHAPVQAAAIALALVPLAAVGMVAIVALLARLVPPPPPGRHRLRPSGPAFGWMWAFQLQRIAFLPLWRPLWLGPTLTRFVVLRALRAQVAPTAMVSSDVTLTDPSLLILGPGSLLGSGALVGGHLVAGDRLLLAPVELGAGAMVFIRVSLAPGCRLGPGAVVGPLSALGPSVIVGAGAHLGAQVSVEGPAEIGAGARIGTRALIGRDVIIGERARIDAGSHIPAGTVVPAGSRWPC